jgi:opacity protein-like surface antigen
VLVVIERNTPKENPMRKMAFILGFFVCSLVPLQTFAITGLGIGVRGGLIQNYKNPNLNSLPTEKDFLKEMPLAGIHLKIGTLPIIDLEASLEYAWKKKEIILEDKVKIKADLTVNDFSFNATAKYAFSVPVVKPYVGLGVGYHRMVYKISVENYAGYFPDDENTLGFHGVGGVLLKFPVLPFEFFGEGRYTIVQTKNEATKFTTILAGVTFNLP